MNTHQNISTLLPSQLPAYIRDDPAYSKFVSFFQAYYEWMEQSSSENNTNVLYNTKNLLNYNDVDTSTKEFLQYYLNDFLHYFPKDSLLSEQLALKTARELYRTKGTISSYQFLFRILYDSDFDVFYTKDALFKTSDGVWYVPKSLRLATTDLAFLNTKNLRIFGETSKSIATIENSIVSGNKIEVFISNIERLFSSGEIVKIVDSRNQDLYFLNGDIVSSNTIGSYVLQAKVVGQISQININPDYRGENYNLGDPVVVYGGLNGTTNNPIGATAEVGAVTVGYIHAINVIDGGFGYQNYPNTQVVITDQNVSGARAHIGSVTTNIPPAYAIINGGVGYNVNDVVIKGNISNTFVAFADVSGVDMNGSITNITYRNGLDANTILGVAANIVSSNTNAKNASISISSVPGSAAATASHIVSDSIDLKTFGNWLDGVGHQNANAKSIVIGNSINYPLGNASYYANTYSFSNFLSANVNTKLSDAFTFQSFETFSISSVIVDNGGGGINKIPAASAESLYNTDVYDPMDPTNYMGTNIQGALGNLGILSPPQIINPGVGYRVNDILQFSSGIGHGANAVVTQISSTGGILSVAYAYPNATKIEYPLGGMGYRSDQLPSITINSANTFAANAVLTIPSILGTGAELAVITDRVGAVTTINLITYGEDYISAPSVSLRIQDIVVSNVYLDKLPQNGDIIYQGGSIKSATYFAVVNSIEELLYDAIPGQSLFKLRVYNYNTPNLLSNFPLKIQNKSISLNLAPPTISAAGSNILTYPENYFTNSKLYDSVGTITYGDGNARATSKFLNGLTIGSGQYLSTKGQPSSFSVLQSKIYNNYTYQITVEKEISKYRSVLLNLLHPTGMQLIGRYAMKANTSAVVTSEDSLNFAHSLYYYTQIQASNVSMSVVAPTKSTNIIKFNNIGTGVNIANFIFANSSIQFITANNDIIRSEISSIDSSNNTITIASNVWLTFANVATVTAISGSNVASVNTLTDKYNIINNAKYNDANVPLKDIIRTGDSILISNNTYKIVSSVDYVNNIIHLTSNLTGNTNNSFITVNRTLNANALSVQIYGPIGQQYIPNIIDELGNILTTEDGSQLILG